MHRSRFGPRRAGVAGSIAAFSGRIQGETPRLGQRHLGAPWAHLVAAGARPASCHSSGLCVFRSAARSGNTRPAFRYASCGLRALLGRRDNPGSAHGHMGCGNRAV